MMHPLLNSSLSSLSSLSQTNYVLCSLWLCCSLSASLYRQTNKHTPCTAGNLQNLSCSIPVCDKLNGDILSPSPTILLLAVTRQPCSYALSSGSHR
jgi:hypothetical protein